MKISTGMTIALVVIVAVVGGWMWYQMEVGEQLSDLAASLSTEKQVTDEEQDDLPIYEREAIKNVRDETYYNSYLGVAYTVPSGWWLYEVSVANFNPDQNETAKRELLEVISLEDGEYLDLISVGSEQFSKEINHLGVGLTVDKYTGVSEIDEFMEHYDAFMLEPEEGETYKLETAEPVTIGGKGFARRVYLVMREEDNFYVDAYVTEVSDDYFLIVTANYWPEMQNASSIVANHLEKYLRVD